MACIDRNFKYTTSVLCRSERDTTEGCFGGGGGGSISTWNLGIYVFLLAGSKYAETGTETLSKTLIEKKRYLEPGHSSIYPVVSGQARRDGDTCWKSLKYDD